MAYASKRAKYEDNLGGEFFVGLDKNRASHVIWQEKNNAEFDQRVKTGEVCLAAIPIVIYKDLYILANPYAGEIHAEFRSFRKKMSNSESTVGKILRLTLAEFELFQQTLPWMKAFILKNKDGRLGLDYKSPGVTFQDQGYLGYSKPITKDFTVVMKFKMAERVTLVELRRYDQRFNICAAGIENFLENMSLKVNKSYFFCLRTPLLILIILFVILRLPT
jgi:hypothetical protein